MRSPLSTLAALALTLATVATGATVAVGGAAGAATARHASEVMTIITTGTLAGAGEQPKFTNSSWTVRRNERVTLTIISYDDGTAPLMGMNMRDAMVAGTTNGTETVNGTTTGMVPDIDIAHTFTVRALGLNVAIPAAPTGGHVTVRATFVAHRSGTFVWRCLAPCGSGATGMAGAMSTTHWMMGRIKVVA